MPPPLPCRVLDVRVLRFDDGTPVRAASGIAPFEDGWLVASDDATHAARWTPGGLTRLRLLPPIDGDDLFDDELGNKRRKPDLEAVCQVPLGAAAGVLLLGSGSTRRRMRAALIEEGTHAVAVADLSPLYAEAADALGIPLRDLNLEGACVVGRSLRWFQRGNAHLAVDSASVDVDLSAVLDAVRGGRTDVAVGSRRRYALGALAITDALALPDGRLLVSAAAEHTTDSVDDGPVEDAALALLDGTEVVALGRLPGEPHRPRGPDKVEGLGLVAVDAVGDEMVAHIVAVVDADDPGAASRALRITLTLP